ncbi:MAG: hypothetical protein FJ290_13305 [Planctomycetes bacterium]|nr:hypothetical protein [Planctomycetota bacterium]
MNWRNAKMRGRMTSRGVDMEFDVQSQKDVEGELLARGLAEAVSCFAHSGPGSFPILDEAGATLGTGCYDPDTRMMLLAHASSGQREPLRLTGTFAFVQF